MAELGGDQCIRVRDHNCNWITIPLKFNGDIMTLDINEPPEEELLALRVNWLMPPMEKITSQSIRRSRVALESHNIQIPGQLRPILEEELSVPQSDIEPKVGKGCRTIKEWKELLAFP